MALIIAMAFQLAAIEAQQEGGGGLRFPNLFAGLGGGNNPFSLSNLFRQGRPAQQQQPAGPPFPGAPPQPLSPIVVAQQPGPNPFLQAPPPAFQPAVFPTFVPNPGEDVRHISLALSGFPSWFRNDIEALPPIKAHRRKRDNNKKEADRP